MKKVIRLLNSVDAKAYQNLLAQSFGSAEGFSTVAGMTLWGQPENYYPTFGVFHDDILVSMMRTEWVLTQKELEYKISGPYQNPEMQFPAMYLAKAATLPQNKGQGLNSVLRYLSLQMAVAWKVRFVFGVMVEGSPRIFTMQQMGYQFQKQNQKWNGNFVSQRTPLLGVLDLSTHASQAFQYLERNVQKYLSDCDLQVDVSTIQIETNSKIRWPWSA